MGQSTFLEDLVESHVYQRFEQASAILKDEPFSIFGDQYFLFSEIRVKRREIGKFQLTLPKKDCTLKQRNHRAGDVFTYSMKTEQFEIVIPTDEQLLYVIRPSDNNRTTIQWAGHKKDYYAENILENAQMGIFQNDDNYPLAGLVFNKDILWLGTYSVLVHGLVSAGLLSYPN